MPPVLLIPHGYFKSLHAVTRSQELVSTSEISCTTHSDTPPGSEPGGVQERGIQEEDRVPLMRGSCTSWRRTLYPSLENIIPLMSGGMRSPMRGTRMKVKNLSLFIVIASSSDVLRAKKDMLALLVATNLSMYPWVEAK